MLGFSFGMVDYSANAASCNGVNKRVNDREETTQVKYVYLDSYNATKLAAKISNDISTAGFATVISGMVPGMQGVSFASKVSTHYTTKHGNAITNANASGNGVKLKYERNMNNKDTNHMWFPNGVFY